VSRPTVHPGEGIIIVSGLPRSGTSLMMQMLAAGGLALTADGLREADAHNPRGYLEDERVKSLRSESAWLGEARGTALKVVAPLLPFLPSEHRYRVIWMERDLDEVLASQRHMLHSSSDSGARDESELRRAFEGQLDRVRTQLRERGIPWLAVEHRDALENPAATATRVGEFLDLDLDAAAAAGVVDRALHRQRAGPP
jgi:ElaB/YqjD/DUF883 family membrane-anchored ribosome-binding protein